MPSYKSIEDANYDSAVEVNTVAETVQGQTKGDRAPDEGKVTVSEIHVSTDQVIVDPHHPLAVQVPPEGSSVGNVPPIGQGFAEGKSALDVFNSGEPVDSTKEAGPVEQPAKKSAKS